MSVTHTTTTSWKNGNGTPLSTSVSVTADGESNFDSVVNTGVTDQLVSKTVDRTKVQSIYILSDTDVTLKTNSTGSPTDTIALVARVPVDWTINDTLAKCPITASVTAFYLTNAAGRQANINLRILANL
jgi:hypothetical protein